MDYKGKIKIRAYGPNNLGPGPTLGQLMVWYNVDAKVGHNLGTLPDVGWVFTIATWDHKHPTLKEVRRVQLGWQMNRVVRELFKAQLDKRF